MLFYDNSIWEKLLQFQKFVSSRLPGIATRYLFLTNNNSIHLMKICVNVPKNRHF